MALKGGGIRVGVEAMNTEGAEEGVTLLVMVAAQRAAERSIPFSVEVINNSPLAAKLHTMLETMQPMPPQAPATSSVLRMRATKRQGLAHVQAPHG
jgi:hypothetical protein